MTNTTAPTFHAETIDAVARIIGAVSLMRMDLTEDRRDVARAALNHIWGVTGELDWALRSIENRRVFSAIVADVTHDGATWMSAGWAEGLAATVLARLADECPDALLAS